MFEAMPIAKRAKIAAEFKTEEETKKLDEILRRIRKGLPDAAVQLFGYPVDGVVADPYPAATGWTYEGGMKARLFGDRLDHVGRAVAQRVHGPALDSVQVSLAVVILQPGTFSSHKDQLRTLGNFH